MSANTWMQLAVTLAFCAAAFGAGVLYLDTRPRAGEQTCWKDPEPHAHLDFDFHTFVSGRPVRCGYLEPRKGDILPHVLGEEDRAVYSDIMCYSMVPTPCPEAKP